MDVAAAWALAEEHLAEALPRRWQHSQAVAATAADYAARLRLDPDVVAAAAWLHDVGYAPPLVDTGFHPLDRGTDARSGDDGLKDHGLGRDPEFCHGHW
ncbi:HD domain-containing protein [Kineococcus glutinatus]|uniref:HD domain-containing protein n=1 Tax=Kineococcus glutinatus TaxID=1070872 RepID=A0ABP9HED8_9ACTN